MKIISNAEIVNILGLQNEPESNVEMINGAATQMLYDILGVASLDVHTVTNEDAKIIEGMLYLNDFPVNTVGISLKYPETREIIVGTFSFELPPQHLRSLRVLFNGRALGITDQCVLATYSAGYQLNSKITLTTITSQDGKTFTVSHAGVVTTYTLKTTTSSSENEILIGVDTTALAANIAAKLGGTSALGVVTLPIGHDATALTATMTIVNSDLPKNLRIALALLAGGMLSKEAQQGVVRLKIDDKEVQFSDDFQKNMFCSVVETYLIKLRRASFTAI